MDDRQEVAEGAEETAKVIKPFCRRKRLRVCLRLLNCLSSGIYALTVRPMGMR